MPRGKLSSPLHELMRSPTSIDEMRAMLPGVDFYIYHQLKEHSTLPRLPFIVLYEISPGRGHWVLVTETPEGIEHFDSYGLKPDGEFSFVPLMFRAQSGQASPHLVRLLLNTGRPINFSNARLQSMKTQAATCGRWCAIRQLFSDMKSDDFIRMIRKAAKKHRINGDELAVLLTIPHEWA